MKGFDLDTAPDIAAIEDEGVTIHLKDEMEELMFDVDEATGKKEPVTWTVCGTYSHTYRMAMTAIKAKWTKRAKAGDEVTRDRDDVEVASACTRGYSGFRNKKTLVPFTSQNAEMILNSTKAQHPIRKLCHEQC